MGRVRLPQKDQGSSKKMHPSEDGKLEDFHLFPRLPVELRCMIWEKGLAMAQYANMNPLSVKAPLTKPVIAISQTCREAYAVVLRTHDFVFRNWAGELVRSDMNQSIFLTSGMTLPTEFTVRGSITPEWPIRRLVSIDRHLVDENRDITQMFQLPSVIGDMDTDLDLECFPKLEEFSMAYTRTQLDWWLEGHQRYRPEIVRAAPKNCLWDVDLDPDYRLNATAYFAMHDISADTGVRWEVDIREDPWDSMAMWRAKQLNNGVSHAVPSDMVWACRPNVGFMGLSRDSTSHGGFWFGFRFYTDTCKAEFSPLSWDEVKDTTLACQTTYNGHRNRDVKTHFPEMVVKVFIIRPGQVPWPQESHHAWEEIPKWVNDEHVDTSKVRLLWKLIRDKFNREDFS